MEGFGIATLDVGCRCFLTVSKVSSIEGSEGFWRTGCGSHAGPRSCHLGVASCGWRYCAEGLCIWKKNHLANVHTAPCAYVPSHVMRSRALLVFVLFHEF